MTWSIPRDEDIHAILAHRIDVERRGVGIVAGIIDGGRHRTVASGVMNNRDGRPVGGDTVFEIGSITKVFTSLILADMAERDEVSLDDEVAQFLPEGVTMPTRDGRQITLLDLATHWSGLPFMDPDFKPRSRANPFADYDVDHLYRFISHYQLPQDTGARFVYSNLGAGLLGHVLALSAGVDFEALVRLRITEPLGMTSTAIVLTPDMEKRRADAHRADSQPTNYLDVPSLAGTGALRSTVHDMLRFAGAVLGQFETPLLRAMAAQRTLRRPAEPGRGDIALGWRISIQGGHEILFHPGTTIGCRSVLGLVPEQGVGVVVLANSAATGHDIGAHLLSGAPLAPLAT